MDISLDVTSLPYVMWAEKGNLPTHSCIYFVLSENDKLLYIGITINLKNRWTAPSHHRHKQMMVDYKIAFIKAELDKEMQILEGQLITTLKPEWNRKRIPRPPVPGFEHIHSDQLQTHSDDADKYITTTEASITLELTRDRLLQLLLKGHIKGAIKPGRDWLIPLYNGKPIRLPTSRNGRAVLEHLVEGDAWIPASIRNHKFSRLQGRELLGGKTVETKEGIFRRADWEQRRGEK